MSCSRYFRAVIKSSTNMKSIILQLLVLLSISSSWAQTQYFQRRPVASTNFYSGFVPPQSQQVQTNNFQQQTPSFQAKPVIQQPAANNLQAQPQIRYRELISSSLQERYNQQKERTTTTTAAPSVVYTQSSEQFLSETSPESVPQTQSHHTVSTTQHVSQSVPTVIPQSQDVPTFVTAPQTVRNPIPVSPLEEELFRQQAESARYSFKSTLSDGIMDNVQFREETRDGLSLKGVYSYSDGYFKRTVHYVADDKGYRVVREEVEPIGNGPQFNVDGSASVNSNVGGVDNRYTITAYDIPRLLRQ